MIDKKFRAPRIWSNKELKKFAYLFSGNIVNVSGWKDIDKEGHRYRDYFSNASEYWITNYKSDARGYQGDLDKETFLDLSENINFKMYDCFDVVFNHTVLEHIFEINIAFRNLCKLSSDIVIIVVPFLQEQHADYGDYWRFTPQAIDRLFQKNGFKIIYINYNDSHSTSIYIFAIGSKKPKNWEQISNDPENKMNYIYDSDYFIGKKTIKNHIIINTVNKLKKTIKYFVKTINQK